MDLNNMFKHKFLPTKWIQFASAIAPQRTQCGTFFQPSSPELAKALVAARIMMRSRTVDVNKHLAICNRTANNNSE